MVNYELKIESSEETIEINENEIIKSAVVIFDTVNENAQKKTNSIVVRVNITGQINSTVNEALIKIMNWTRDLKNDTTYRNVTLTVHDDEGGSILRIYELPAMFVCDFKENFGDTSSDDSGTFELKLIQKENQLKEIKAYSK